MATAAASAEIQITKCPAMPAHGFEHFDLYQCVKLKYPVSATFRGGDDWESNGLDFADYKRCGTTEKRLAPSRRMDAPEWAFDDSKIRALVVRTMELRAAFRTPQPGTDAERLQRAQVRIAEVILPKKAAALKRQCLEFDALKKQITGEESQRYMQNIQQLDSEVCALQKPDRGAATLVAIIDYYYGCGMDSVGVATQLGMKPPAVRQQLWRMKAVWERMKTETVSAAPAPRLRKVRVARMKPARLCQRCGGIVELGGDIKRRGKYCEACRPWAKKRYVAEYDKSKRALKEGTAFCTNRGCKRPLLEGFKQCAACRDYYNVKQREYYQRHRERICRELRDARAAAHAADKN